MGGQPVSDGKSIERGNENERERERARVQEAEKSRCLAHNEPPTRSLETDKLIDSKSRGNAGVTVSSAACRVKKEAQ